MENMLTFTGIIIIVFGILQIILFFKLWRMTNDVRKIKSELCSEKDINEATVLYLKGEKKTAYTKLYNAFLYEVAIAGHSTWTDNPADDYIDSFRKIMRRYKPMFEKIGLGHPDYTLYDELEKVKL